jgi:hypothetical protein
MYFALDLAGAEIFRFSLQLGDFIQPLGIRQQALYRLDVERL